MATGGGVRILAVKNASANALGQEDVGLKQQKEGLCGWSIRSGVRDEQSRVRMVACRSVDCVPKAVGSRLLWEAVQPRKGCDFCVGSGL